MAAIIAPFDHGVPQRVALDELERAEHGDEPEKEADREHEDSHRQPYPGPSVSTDM
jgi:hypothetical protein